MLGEVVVSSYTFIKLGDILEEVIAMSCLVAQSLASTALLPHLFLCVSWLNDSLSLLLASWRILINIHIIVKDQGSTLDFDVLFPASIFESVHPVYRFAMILRGCVPAWLLMFHGELIFDKLFFWILPSKSEWPLAFYWTKGVIQIIGWRICYDINFPLKIKSWIWWHRPGI